MSDSRYSDNEISGRDIPSFIEPRPPVIPNPFMRSKLNLLSKLYEEDSECEEPELVQVYLRLKPCYKPSNLYEIRSDRCLITSLDTTTAGHGRRTQHNVSKMYTFTHIFGPDSRQQELFDSVVKDNLKKLPEGHNFTLLTYGASGSGKTFTLMGTVSSPGLIPRSLEYIFKVVDVAQSPELKPADRGAERLTYAQQNYELQVSFIEIYNEGIYDLLVPGDRKNSTKLGIREDSSGNVYVKGAIQTFVKSGEEAYDVMVAGKHNLQVAATGIHAQSSRSHCIFTITMITESEDGVRSSCVRLCDLAGCERASRTRNTGARMHESRAINTSLHVLERCLRVLRKRNHPQAAAALVPYRESKLTRLLGAGLSGSRGEAVSMVVTLNPAPEYANETRHVLQLAAVAKDIQINNTMSEYPSSLESSTQEATITSSTEIMQLRADNERLHFELVQAQSCIKELQSCMDERQATEADTMKELVEETKAITRDYYEIQIKILRDEMEQMEEEYESRLNKTVSAPNGDTPLKNMQLKIKQLMTENAILEEKYTAEKLARARAEGEVQHLRACIDERDEKTDEDIPMKEDLVDLCDCEESDDDDSCNESLEPIFKREDINRSRMIHQSAIIDENSLSSDLSDNSVLNKTYGTLKDENINNSNGNDCTFETDNDVVAGEVVTTELNIDVHNNIEFKNHIKLSRETYLVENNDSFVNDKKKVLVSTLSRASNEDIVVDINDKTKTNKNRNSFKDSSLETVHNNKPNTFVNNIINSIKESNLSIQSNNSLASFEKLEEATKIDTGTNSNATNFFNIKILKEKRNFFNYDDVLKSLEKPATIVKCKDKKIYFDNSNNNDISNNDNEKIKIDDYRSPSIVKEDVTNDYEPSMIKKLLGQSITNQNDNLNALQKIRTCDKKNDSIDLFEALDSPQACNKNKVNDDIENIRKSVQNVAIIQEDAIVCGNIEHNQEIVSNDELNNVEETNENKHVKEIVNDVDVESNKDNTIKKEETMKISLERSDDIEKVSNDETQLLINNTKSDNTSDEFENIYKDITTPRATEFDLLVSQEIKDTTIDTTTNNEKENEDLKYNLRQKSKMDKPKNETRRGKKVLESSPPKCEKSKTRKRNLRLRRQCGDNSEDGSKDIDEDTKKRDIEKAKLKDIINLQKEFSDVTLDKPAPAKEFKDIPSPEKNDNENLAPILGIQSCPAKSTCMTRTRRKLFTPRPEPLEESMEQSANSNERLRVPRPSYHKTRVRRKL
uniref:Similar to kinesin-like protein c n=20 Tax=Heliconius TaxID=33416 RepID=C3PPF6_HELME|nr:unnamed protein product [Heliconius melpomene]